MYILGNNKHLLHLIEKLPLLKEKIIKKKFYREIYSSVEILVYIHINSPCLDYTKPALEDIFVINHLFILKKNSISAKVVSFYLPFLLLQLIQRVRFPDSDSHSSQILTNVCCRGADVLQIMHFPSQRSHNLPIIVPGNFPHLTELSD